MCINYWRISLRHNLSRKCRQIVKFVSITHSERDIWNGPIVVTATSREKRKPVLEGNGCLASSDNLYAPWILEYIYDARTHKRKNNYPNCVLYLSTSMKNLMVNHVIKNFAASLWNPKFRYIVQNISLIFRVLRMSNTLYFISLCCCEIRFSYIKRKTRIFV